MQPASPRVPRLLARRLLRRQACRRKIKPQRHSRSPIRLSTARTSLRTFLPLLPLPCRSRGRLRINSSSALSLSSSLGLSFHFFRFRHLRAFQLCSSVLFCCDTVSFSSCCPRARCLLRLRFCHRLLRSVRLWPPSVAQAAGASPPFAAGLPRRPIRQFLWRLGL